MPDEEPIHDLPLTQPETVEQDMRSAVLLVDAARREFLAYLDPNVVNSYAVLYARHEKWVAYAERNFVAAAKRGEPNAARWKYLAERWRTGIHWLDRNLVMSGAIHGRRAEQLVDVLTGAKDPPSVGGTQVVVPQVYQPAPQPKSKLAGLWGR